MKTLIAVALGLMLLAASPGRAQDYGASPDEPYPVALEVGETFEVCLSGQMICPPVRPICDDLNVAIPVDTPDGLGFKAVRIGSTLCSASNSAGQRRVFRIEVHPRKHK